MTEPIRLWRSLEELEENRGPRGEAIAMPAAFSPARRDFLKLAAAAAALAGAGCRGPVEEIVPYVRAPDAPAGLPSFYATEMTLGGLATGLLVESNMGRPTKVEGNPAHPASLGATDVFAQASVLQLWDPDRSQAIRRAGAIVSRAELESEWHDALAKLEARRGAGLRILTGDSGSPTLAAQMDAVLARFPEARRHRWEALHRDNSFEGSRLAFGRPLETVYRFAEADIVLALDADFLGEGPGHLRYAREFAGRRAASAERPMNRLYAVETAPTLAGAMADHRLPLPPAAILAWLAELDAALRGAGNATLPLVRAAARDLLAHRGRAVVVPGESLPPEAHALVHRMNADLGAEGRCVLHVEPVAMQVNCTQSLRELVQDLEGGRVSALVMLGVNPVHDAPADLRFADALKRAPLTLHLGLYEDETAASCRWHLPEAHFLEDWSDARAFDGTASIVQPLIAPLHGGISRHEVMALLAGVSARPRDAVRAQWQRRATGPFEDFWRGALREGLIAGTAEAPVHAAVRHAAFVPPKAAADAWTVRLRADPSVRDGSFANNAWLQELPRPASKLTWDNAALMSAESAAKLGAKTGDVVEIAAGGGRVRAPVWILPDHADGAVTLSLGYGRTRAGRVGNAVGVDAYPIRTAASPWGIDAAIRKVPGRHAFATTQNHARMEGRDPVRRVLASDLA